jgi:replicative DNA helicase
MIDISLIKLLLNKENYASYRELIEVQDFSKDLQGIVRTIDNYYKGDNVTEDLTVDSLSNLYFAVNRRDLEYYQGIFENIKNNESSVDSCRDLISGIRRTRQLRDLSLDAYEASEGRKSFEEIQQKYKEVLTTGEASNVGKDEDVDFVTDDLVEIANLSRSMASLRWRLDSLNKTLGGLRKGNFGFVFARPETGKTTFLASEVTHMASQLGEEAGPILWLNNEQVGTEVMIRCYQATLGCDLTQLYADLEGNRKRYHESTKGKIRLIDSATITKNQVEKVCQKYMPSLVVFDQIDKIKGFENDREDLRLGSIYIWARELAKSHCPVIGVCQADGSGEGQRWLTMANVANAKTSKQAEADWILGIGKVNDAGYDNLRFMHLSKNKLPGDEDTDPHRRHDRWETLIEPMIGRYRDL